MAEETLVCVAAFDDPNFANIARLRLEAAGIRAALDGEHHVAADWLVTNAVGGIKLLVMGNKREQALRILNSRADLPSDIEFGDDSPIDEYEPCPNCNSIEVYRERLNRHWIFTSMMILGIPLPFFSNRLVCRLCQYRGESGSAS